MNDTFKRDFTAGKNERLHERFGSHLLRDGKNDIIATEFLVYAPHAQRVFLICEINNFSESDEMISENSDGFYYIRIEKNLEGMMYKYKIYDKNDNVHIKNDPFGYFHELRPNTASKVYDINGYQWCDQPWFNKKTKIYDKPLLIYEMHFGSWQRKNGNFETYHELADTLIEYLQKHHYTHVEFMPIYEHPLDDSWGYQGTNFFASTSRYGTPKELMYLIDKLHQADIGVLMDWVLGHICKDSHGLALFDGSFLYEFEDSFRRDNVDWGTSNLDFSKGITRSFMLSALFFWIEYFHIDGFRIDAVSRLIYYLGDSNNGINHDAIEFIKVLGLALFSKDDRILFMAEDSTSYPQVTHPISDGGLGFNYKWNMGFMNDTLSYFQKDPIYRKYEHSKITFGIQYTYSENFILPFSHDEVVHMKNSLLNKMAGNPNDKFAQWRLLMTLFMTYPGKKLLFMGQEFAQSKEWDFKTEIQWELLQQENHRKANRFFIDLTKIYRNNDTFYQYDHEPKGFEWLVVDDSEQSVFSYLRKSEHKICVVILNMTSNYHEYYPIAVPFKGVYKEIIDSSDILYGGKVKHTPQVLETMDSQTLNYKQYIKPTLNPFSGIILEFVKK